MLLWGIGSAIFMVVGATALVHITPGFSLKENAFSGIVRFPHRLVPFFLLCLITLIARGVYIYALVVEFNLSAYPWLITVVSMSWLLLLIVILIPVTIHKKLHKYLALVALYLSLIFLVGFQWLLLPADGIGKMIVSLLLIVPFALNKLFKNWGPPEASIAMLVFLWDLHILFL